MAKAKQLLREAGQPNLTFTLIVPPERDRQEAAQIIQAMLAEAGITMNLQTQENVTMLTNGRKGDFEAYFTFWSGRPDPDGNVFTFNTCEGAQNDSHYCNAEVDALLTKARQVARSGRAQEALRPGDRDLDARHAAAAACGTAGCSPATRVKLHGLHGLSGRHHSAARAEAELDAAGALHRAAGGGAGADAVLRLGADLLAAEAPARRRRPGAGRRGARSGRGGGDPRQVPPRPAGAGAVRPSGWARCCAATSGSRCATASR